MYCSSEERAKARICNTAAKRWEQNPRVSGSFRDAAATWSALSEGRKVSPADLRNAEKFYFWAKRQITV